MTESQHTQVIVSIYSRRWDGEKISAKLHHTIKFDTDDPDGLAALIVRAVNAHEGLVGALRGLVRALRSMPPPASQALGLITIIEAMQEAQAAIALVEEEA